MLREEDLVERPLAQLGGGIVAVEIDAEDGPEDEPLDGGAEKPREVIVESLELQRAKALAGSKGSSDAAVSTGSQSRRASRRRRSCLRGHASDRSSMSVVPETRVFGWGLVVARTPKKRGGRGSRIPHRFGT